MNEHKPDQPMYMRARHPNAQPMLVIKVRDNDKTGVVYCHLVTTTGAIELWQVKSEWIDAGLYYECDEFGSGLSGDHERLAYLWVMCVVQDDKGCVLVELRPDGVEIDPGKWGPPGGKVRYGEHLEDAAIREFCEEVPGLEMLEPEIVGYISSDPRGVAMIATGQIADNELLPDGWQFISHDVMTFHNTQGGLLKYLRGGYRRTTSSQHHVEPI